MLVLAFNIENLFDQIPTTYWLQAGIVGGIIAMFILLRATRK